MNAIGIIAVVAVFGSGLVNALIYLKKVRELLKYLQDKHYEKIKEWKLPDSLMDASVKRSSKLLKFLKSPDYFNDIALKEMKKNVYTHLKLHYVIIGGGAVLLIIIFTVIGILSAK